MTIEIIVGSVRSMGIPFSDSLGFLDAAGEMSPEELLKIIEDYDHKIRILHGESDVVSSFRNGLDPHEERRFFGLNEDEVVSREYQRRLLEYIYLGSCFAGI